MRRIEIKYTERKKKEQMVNEEFDKMEENSVLHEIGKF